VVRQHLPAAIDGFCGDGLKYVRRHQRPKFQFYAIGHMRPPLSELGRFDVIIYFGVLHHTMYPFEQPLRAAMARNALASVASPFLYAGEQV
jgi:hypothetical protein